jgi:hypothetical protein
VLDDATVYLKSQYPVLTSSCYPGVEAESALHVVPAMVDAATVRDKAQCLLMMPKLLPKLTVSFQSESTSYVLMGCTY